MRSAILSVLLVGALLPVAAGAEEPGCVCTDGYASGGGLTCTTWRCDPIILKAPYTPVKSASDCPDSRKLFCEDTFCALGCPLDNTANKQ